MTKQHGFSLVELMVAVAIVGILATIAVPNYSNYKIKSSRTAVQTELLQLAAIQEKIYLNSSAYASNIPNAYTGQSSGGLGKTGSVSEDGRYDISFGSSAAQSYEIWAKPKAGTTQVGDGCLTIGDRGQRFWHQGSDACAAANPTAW